MPEPDPNSVADELERQGEELERRSQQLQQDTAEVRQDWERKRANPQVPGAPAAETADQEPEAEFPAKENSLEDETGSAA